MTSSKLHISNKNPQAIDFALQQAANEGWNPGIHDRTPFKAADPHGFFLATRDEKPIGCASAVCYNEHFAFFGFYIVISEFRGKGYGSQIIKHSLETVKDHNIGLDGVIENESMYTKIGFQTDFITQRYRIQSPGQTQHSLHPSLTPVNKVPFPLLSDYDQHHFPAPRNEFLKAWISQPNYQGFAYIDNATIKGYGLIRPCLKGYKIGPLFADHKDIAKAILEGLLSQIHQTSVLIDIPLPNQQGLQLLSPFSPQKVFACARMYTKSAPLLNLNNTFGLTSFELG